MNSSSRLIRTSPEEQGISSSALLRFAQAVNSPSHEVHSFMLLRHGAVVAEGWWAPYRSDTKHMLFSLSKSFTSTAAGIAISEGAFSLDDPVIKFFPQDVPSVITPNLKAMRVRHLLSMSTGQATDTLGSLFSGEHDNWPTAFFAVPVEYEPGTHFLYNSGATYMVSAIVQKTTGQKVVDFLRPRLFEPLNTTEPQWDVCPDGVNTGGWGLWLTTEDIAKFGQLYLQKGSWEGCQLVPESWVNEATSRQISNGSNPDNDWEQGYGFQFWRCRHGAYRGDGAFGQFCVVMPEQDAALAITGGCADMGAILNVAWEYLLPEMQNSSLPADEAAHQALVDALATLEFPRVKGDDTSRSGRENTGRVYELSPNAAGYERITFEFGDSGSQFVIEDEMGRHTVRCGNRDWQYGQTTLPIQPNGERHILENRTALNSISAAGVWTEPGTFTMQIRYLETPFVCTYTFRFDERKVVVNAELNVSFGPTTGLSLEGHCE